MTFLNPWLLLGLAGVGVPVLIHLLNRYRFRETDWAAMQFLARAARVRSRRIRLEDILLLLLRCLAVLLAVLAVARPAVREAGLPAAPGAPRAGVVIALDGSYSMMHKPGIRSRFDHAVVLARELAGTMRQGDPVTLVVLGSRPRVLLRNVGYDPGRVDGALSDISPLEEPLNLDAGAAALRRLAADMKAVQREVYLLTDGQARDWHRLSDAAKEQFAELGTIARMFLVTVPVESSENAGVTGLELVSGALHKGSIARFAATVRNFGHEPTDHLRVVCRVNGVPVDEKSVGVLRGGETTTVSLFVPVTQTGNVRIDARIGNDGLTLDNTRRTVAKIRETVSILCVDGDPSAEPFEGAADFVGAALAAGGAGGADGSFSVKTVPWLALPTERFSEYDVVVLANVAEIAEDQVMFLHDFLRRRGGLILFAGENVQPALWNDRMTVSGTPLLPAELLGVSAGHPFGREGIPLSPAMPDHPVVRPIRSLPSDVFGEIRFRRFMKVRVHPQGRVLLRLAGTDDPILVEKQVGRGRILLFTSSADRRWHTMITNPAYPIMLQQAITYLTSQPERPSIVGTPLTAVLPGQQSGVEVTFEDPSGRVSRVQAVERQGQVVAVLRDPERAGFYDARYSIEQPAVSLAVNPDTAESDVRILPGEKLEETVRDLPFRVVHGGKNLASIVRETRVGREFWRTLMLAALCVLAVESFLARRYSLSARNRQ